jgi:hypothetical protein
MDLNVTANNKELHLNVTKDFKEVAKDLQKKIKQRQRKSLELPKINFIHLDGSTDR